MLRLVHIHDKHENVRKPVVHIFEADREPYDTLRMSRSIMTVRKHVKK
jgi:hypothetical protein